MESPRFISTLKRALEDMFLVMDKDNSGSLSYSEFKDSFRTLSYGLNDNDINMLISMADSSNPEADEEETICWRDFIQIGIEAIKTFYTRNIALKKAAQLQNPDPESLKLVLWDEILKTYNLLSYKFKAADTIED